MAIKVEIPWDKIHSAPVVEHKNPDNLPRVDVVGIYDCLGFLSSVKGCPSFDPLPPPVPEGMRLIAYVRIEGDNYGNDTVAVAFPEVEL